MTMRSGAAGQIGFAPETTYGTRVVPTKFLPLVNETMSHDRERVESEGIIPGVSVIGSGQWNGGNITVGGDVGFELYTEGLDPLLLHMFGDVTLTGSGPYTRVYKPLAGAIDGKSMTVQIGTPGTGGIVHPFDFLGCKVASWQLGCSQGQIATLGLTLAAKKVVTDQTLAVPAYTAGGIKPFKFNHGQITVAGAEAAITEITVSGDNGLKVDRRFVERTDAGEIHEPLEQTLRAYTANLTAEFVDLTQYTRFVNGTEHPLVLNFTAGAAQFEVSGNVRFDGSRANVSGRDVLTQSIPLKFVRSGATDDTAIQAKTITSVVSA